MRKSIMTPLQLFEHRFIVTPGCWWWKTRSDNPRRRPMFRLEGELKVASRVAYEFYKGPIPRGQIVRHTCDCHYCVNPEHLVVGTYQDNINDMVSRGRHRPYGVLSGQDVDHIIKDIRSEL